MLLKTNETGIEDAEFRHQITENKRLNDVGLRILSMRMNTQEIEEKSVVNRRKVRQFTRKNEPRMPLRNEFSRILMLPMPQFAVAE